MPIIKSAKKRVKTAQTKSVNNARTKKSLRATIKAFHSALTSGSKVNESQVAAQSAIDTAVKKGVMSKNKAARKKKQLSTKAKASGVKTTPAKKTTTKKPVAKKTPAKKTTTKTTTKKTTKK